jgi:uncharacterized protein YydD (DUF2326 family)
MTESLRGAADQADLCVNIEPIRQDNEIMQALQDLRIEILHLETRINNRIAAR